MIFIYLYSCRPREKKATNSERTFTTSNLSQYKYLRAKRQLQQETENRLTAIRTKSSVRSATATGERPRRTSTPALSCNEHQYKLVSDWESECHALCHHFTSYQQRRCPLICQSLKAAATATASHLSEADLSKLLTNIQLSPSVVSNQQDTTFCHSQHAQSSSTSLSGEDDSNSQEKDIAPGCNALQCLPMTFRESFMVSTINMPSTGVQKLGTQGSAAPNTDPVRTSWYNEYLRATLHRLKAKRQRRKTKSAPWSSLSMLRHKTSQQRPEFNPTSSYFSSATER